MIKNKQKTTPNLSASQLSAMARISPTIKELFLKFGVAKVYTRPGLEDKNRKIATISSLITNGDFSQLKWHIKSCLESKVLSKLEIEETIIHLIIYAGFPKSFTAMRVANEVFKHHGKKCNKKTA